MATQKAMEKDKLLALAAMVSGDRVLQPVGGQMLDYGLATAKQKAAGEQQTYQRSQDEIQNALSVARLQADQENHALGRQDRLQAAAERLEAAREREAERRAAAEERQQDRAGVLRDRGVERLSHTLDAGGYSELNQSVGALNKLLEGYPEGTNIPGIGGAANIDKLGIGTALSYVPGIGGGAVARNNQSTAAAVKNAILKARSGGAVTESEAERMLTELSQGMFSTDSDFRAAVGRITQVLDAKVQNVFAGHSPEVVSEYHARGGNVRPGAGKGEWSAKEVP